MKRLVATIRRQSGLIGYTACNYFDKLLTFGVPLLVLYVFRDKSTYNEIEYLYSIAAVVGIVIDAGVSTYFLYAYRDATDKEALVKRMESNFLLQFTAYAVLGGILTAIAFAANVVSGPVFIYILSRSLAAMILAFYTVYFRLVDRPARVFLISIGMNVATIIILFMSSMFRGQVSLLSVFAGQIGLICLAAGYYLVRGEKASLGASIRTMGKSLQFAWPVMLNLFVFMFISNYGKVYARNFLASDDMFHISYVQRMALIIQLAHASAVGYLAKRIFVERAGDISTKVIGLYSAMIICGVGMVFVALLGSQWLPFGQSIRFDVVTIVMILYTVVWCYAAFFELYVNRMNKNLYILVFSAISAVVFVGLLSIKLGSPLTNIAMAMLLSMTCNLALTVWYVYRRSNVERYDETRAADNAPVAVQ